MTEVHQPPARGKGGDPSAVRACLRRFVEAAIALDDAWDADIEAGYPRHFPAFPVIVRDAAAWRDAIEERALPAPVGVPAVDLCDPEARRAWLADLRQQVDDAIAAGEDATRAEDRRVLGRSAARVTILDARVAIGRLLVAASE